MIDDLFAADTAAAARDRIARPPVAPPAEPKLNIWNTVTAVPRGIDEALAQVAATGADVLGGLRYMRDATPEQRKQMDRQGAPIEAYSSAAGDELRKFGREFRPDPATAHAAEQVVYGFSRGAAKVVGGAVLGGPVGVAAAGIAWTIANVFAALSLNEVAKDIRQDRRDLRDAQVRFVQALKTTPNLSGAAELAELFANCCDLQADIDRKQTEAISTGVDLALISAGAGGLMLMAGGQTMSWDSFTSGRGLNLGEVVIVGGLTAWAVSIFMDDDDDRSRRRRRGRGVLASLARG